MRILLIIVTLILQPNLIFCQNELIGELNKVIIPITTISPDSNFTDIEKLIPILKDKEIIGLGEATHGTHEFFVYKHRLTKFLASNLNFKTFIIEADFAGSQTMNEYVLYGKGDPNNGLWKMGISVWMTDEFVEMVEWMRAYNSTKEAKDKIKFYGCDMQNPQIAAQKVKEYLAKNQKLNSLTEGGLDWFINSDYRKKNSKAEKKIVEQSLTEVNHLFESISDTNNREFQFIKHCKRELEQMLEYNSDLRLRDKFMAENTEWIYNFENKDKAILWAHNMHIANSLGKPTPTGYHLKNEFGEKYYSFGFSFFSGNLRAYSNESQKYEIYKIPPVSIEKSADKIFNQCTASNFIIDLKSASTNDKINDFLNTELYMRQIGVSYSPENNRNRNYCFAKLNSIYDGIIFFRSTNPSEAIKQKNKQ